MYDYIISEEDKCVISIGLVSLFRFARYYHNSQYTLIGMLHQDK